jgi:hypothetical protein
MRSLPNFLVVSRSGAGPDDNPKGKSSEPVTGPVLHPRTIVRTRLNRVAMDELKITISVSYRTLLVVFSLFVVISRIVDAVVNAF